MIVSDVEASPGVGGADRFRGHFQGKEAEIIEMAWFDDTTAEIYRKGLCLGISSAVYNLIRVDGTEHNENICDQIVAELRRSRFVVADFTDHRGGVSYEAGFAGRLGLPVVYTCKKNELQNLHFDVRQYNTIDWESAEELAQRLSARISATIGDGPLK
jgi:hypothetical protein